MTRAICLAIALSACAPTYSLTAKRPPPVWLYAADMLVFSAGMVVAINEYSKPSWDPTRNEAWMGAAFAAALLAWGPYWVHNP